MHNENDTRHQKVGVHGTHGGTCSVVGDVFHVAVQTQRLASDDQGTEYIRVKHQEKQRNKNPLEPITARVVKQRFVAGTTQVVACFFHASARECLTHLYIIKRSVYTY